jgi:pyruvate dehydrogenase E1 component alpha subunit/2-oxoisovalerate dehydrogenase E1 component alpha subunit
VTRPPADQLSRTQLVELYHFMKLNRMVEERLTNLYRQGKVVGGLYRSLGQEACSVGSAYALEQGDIFRPHPQPRRDLRSGPAPRRLRQYMAKAGPTRGRDLNVHFGWLSEEGSMPSVISMLGDMIPILTGTVIAERMKGRKTVALNWIGDGGTSTGAFHEGFNFACVQKAPLVLIVENNKYAYSTPTSADGQPRLRGPRAVLRLLRRQVDGNGVLAVYEITRRAIERARWGQVHAHQGRHHAHAWPPSTTV